MSLEENNSKKNETLPIRVNVNTTLTNSANNDSDIVYQEDPMLGSILESSQAYSSRGCSFDHLISKNFDAYQWPSDANAAFMHETATSIGQRPRDRKQEKICPCCGKSASKKPYNWLRADVLQAVGPENGSAVPLLFGLIKYYAGSIALLFCINGIYSIYQYQRLCKLYPLACMKMLGFLPILGNDQILAKLDTDEADIFRWLNFVAYIVILISQIFVDLYIDIKQRQFYFPRQRNPRKTMLKAIPKNQQRTLMIGGIPDNCSEEQLKKLLQEAVAHHLKKSRWNDLDFRNLFFVSDYSRFDEIFQKRLKLFFQCKPLISMPSITDKMQLKLEKNKQEIMRINTELHEAYNSRLYFKGKAFLTMGSIVEARLLKNSFPNSIFRKIQVIFLSLMGRAKKIPLFVQWAPSVQEIKWQNVGIRNTYKMRLIVIVTLIALTTAVISACCLTFLSHVIKGSYILLFNISFMIFQAVFLEYLSEKKKGKTSTSKSFFLLSIQGFFILIYFVLLPVLYYGFADAESTGFRTYGLFILFVFNSFFQFFFLFLNGKHRGHAGFIKNLKKNPEKVTQKHCQKILNNLAQRPEFELEQRMIGVMQLWTFSTLHAFMCPYTQLFSIVFLGIIFFMAKHMLFNQYSLYTFKTLDLQRKFLRPYSLAFQSAVLFMFQIANQTPLQKSLAFSAFILMYLCYITVSYLRSRYTKVHHESLLLYNQDQEEDDMYKKAYDKFQKSYFTASLEQNIQSFMDTPNPFLIDALNQNESSDNIKAKFQ